MFRLSTSSFSALLKCSFMDRCQAGFTPVYRSLWSSCSGTLSIRPSHVEAATVIPSALLQAPGVCRIITTYPGSFWRIVFELSPRVVDTTATLPLARLPPLHPKCLRQLVEFLSLAELPPVHMSSDAGFSRSPFTG